MQTTLIAIVGFIATVVSAAPNYNPTPYDACPDGLYSVPQCCATDVLGVADLNCGSPSAVPSSAASFKAICAAGGQRARCCVVPVLGQSVLCETPAGLGEQ
ncbi:hydrophobin-like protein [Xylariaceae sp. FL1651]|nr:hydrophobin-like protein [Xylariaceae sp. FL1651]